MRGKEFVNDMIYTYLMLVTMILGVMMVLGTHYMPEVRFGYEEFGAPLIYAAWGTLPNVVMYAKKELTMKQFLLRKTIQLLLIEGIVISVATPAQIMEAGNAEVVVALAVGILVVYILAHLIIWFQNYVIAKRMTAELLVFQRNHK